jgi:fermentation-respiration switch protein FrsA (DUF1100 family)
MKLRLAVYAVGFVAILGAACVGGFHLEDKLIYFPTVYPDGYWEPAGLDIEDAWFDAADGTRLHGWYVAHAAPRATVLFAHGNAGNLSGRQGTLHLLHGLRASVLIFDYRGYGRSEGSPDEAGVLQDVRAARNWLADREEIPAEDIVLYGRSLGSAVMVDVAAEEGARAMILHGAFSSMADVAAAHYPRWLVWLLLHSEFDSLSKIAHFGGALLSIHGDADEVVPYEQGKELYEAAPGLKWFVTILGGRHNDPFSKSLRDALDAFFEEIGPSPGGAQR